MAITRFSTPQLFQLHAGSLARYLILSSPSPRVLPKPDSRSTGPHNSLIIHPILKISYNFAQPFVKFVSEAGTRARWRGDKEFNSGGVSSRRLTVCDAPRHSLDNFSHISRNRPDFIVFLFPFYVTFLLPWYTSFCMNMKYLYSIKTFKCALEFFSNTYIPTNFIPSSLLSI